MISLTNDFNNFEREMSNLFDDFLKPINLKFTLPNKDISPIHTEKTKYGYRIVARSVGIDPKDVDVKLREDCDCIHLEGETEKEGYHYSTSYDIPLLDDIRDNIENIKYKSENGITTIYINMKKREKEIIDIQRIDEDKDIKNMANQLNNLKNSCNLINNSVKNTFKKEK